MKVTILGSGTSTGIPVIGCDCAVCVSSTKENKRLRASIALKFDHGPQFVIDTGPDFRQQMLQNGIQKIDGVFYTHMHADHCHGFDDLRAFYFRRKMRVPCFLAKDFAEELQSRFAYAFTDTGYQGVRPQVDLEMIPDEGVFNAAGVEVDTMRVEHGAMQTSVFRFGRFAYSTDFKKFSSAQIARWKGKVDVMVASGVHFEEHATHSVIPETLELFQQLGVKRGIVTHLSHKVDHLRDSARLPPHVVFAYDGMTIDVS